MTLKLKIECMYGRFLEEECKRIIAMDDSSSLYDLHFEILKSVGFDDDHAFAFFIANTPSPYANRDYFKPADSFEDQVDFYAQKELNEIWPLPRKKLYYRFDFGDDWVFEIRKMRSLKADAEIETPKELERIGPNPEQYPYCEY